MKQRSVQVLYQLGESLKALHVQRRMSYIVMIALLAMAAWIAGQMVQQYRAPLSVSKWQPDSVVQGGSELRRIDTSELHNSHIFGQLNQAAPVVKLPKLQSAPKSRLDVTLVGLVISSNPEKSLAVIANHGHQATYGINEVIEGTSAKLIQAQSDRVIIDNSGRNETVMLEGVKYIEPSALIANLPTARSERGHTQDKSLEKIREEIRQDRRMVFQYVRMSQIKKDDEVLGYRLSPGKDKALFESVGLELGDIAVSINGLDLKGSSAMNEILKRLSQLTELTLIVERSGQSHEIYIAL